MEGKQFETISGIVFNLQEHHGLDARFELYEEIRDGLKKPTSCRRIGDIMKIEETEVVGIEKIHIITKVTTIDYKIYNLSHRMKSKEEQNG